MRRNYFPLVLALLMASPLPALSRAEAIEEGVVDEVRGRVEIIGLDNAARNARDGNWLVSGEMLQTGADGFVRVIMSGGSVLELYENTRVEVCDSRANETGMNTVVLYLGRIWASIVKNDYGDTAFEAETPTAVAGVRGTEFGMAVGIDGATRVGVDKGLVDVSSDVGMVEVQAGRETTVDWNRPPGNPAAFQRDQQQWRDWMVSRQDHLIRNGDKIVPGIVADVKKSRQNMAGLRNAGQASFQEWKAYAEKQRLEGKKVEMTREQKKKLLQYLRKTNQAVRELQRADRRMIARAYLLNNIHDETLRNPGAYKPEFIEVVAKAKADLDALDIGSIHRDNLKIIDNYATAMEGFARKHNLSGDLKKRIPPDRKKELERARANYKGKNP